MFKKISELFFGEVEEEIEIEELTKTQETPVVRKEVEVKPQVKQPQKPTPQQPVEKKAKKAEKSIFIDSSTPKKKKDIAAEVKNKERDSEEIEYEFTPVISPIKGLKDHEGATVKVTPKRKSQPTKATSRLGTVLSPYHGLGKGKNTEELPKAAPLEEEVDFYDEQVRESMDDNIKEIEEVSLEEMLSEDGPNLFTTAELHLKEKEMLDQDKEDDMDDEQ